MDQELKDIVEGMNASIKAIVDDLRVAATYVSETPEASVMNKAAETIETLEAEVREQKNHSIRHLGICELRKEVERLKAEIAQLKANNSTLVEKSAHFQESLSRSYEREQRLRDQRDVVRDIIRLAYKTIKQD